jgi:hypothetical protein
MTDLTTNTIASKQFIKRKTHKEVLIENAEDVILMIDEAKNYDDIIAKYKVRREDVAWFIAESDFSARAKEARLRSADKIAEKAEQVLLQLEKGCDNAEIARARELAHHYRWLAAKKNPREYSERTQQDLSISTQDAFVLKRTKSKTNE